MHKKQNNFTLQHINSNGSFDASPATCQAINLEEWKVTYYSNFDPEYSKYIKITPISAYNFAEVCSYDDESYGVDRLENRITAGETYNGSCPTGFDFGCRGGLGGSLELDINPPLGKANFCFIDEITSNAISDVNFYQFPSIFLGKTGSNGCFIIPSPSVYETSPCDGQLFRAQKTGHCDLTIDSCVSDLCCGNTKTFTLIRAKIEGFVRDCDSLSLLSGVTVLLTKDGNTLATTTTDSNGKYSFNDPVLDSPPYIIIGSLTGYDDVSITISSIIGGVSPCITNGDFCFSKTPGVDLVHVMNKNQHYDVAFVKSDFSLNLSLRDFTDSELKRVLIDNSGNVRSPSISILRDGTLILMYVNTINNIKNLKIISSEDRGITWKTVKSSLTTDYDFVESINLPNTDDFIVVLFKLTASGKGDLKSSFINSALTNPSLSTPSDIVANVANVRPSLKLQDDKRLTLVYFKNSNSQIYIRECPNILGTDWQSEKSLKTVDNIKELNHYMINPNHLIVSYFASTTNDGSWKMLFFDKQSDNSWKESSDDNVIIIGTAKRGKGEFHQVPDGGYSHGYFSDTSEPRVARLRSFLGKAS